MTSHRASRGGSQTGGAARRRVLVVDDHDEVRRLTARILSRAGHRVHTADSAESALEIAARVPRLDVLVSDVVMPGMRGPELAEQLAERNPHLRVMLMTGYADPEELARTDGRLSVLRKPFRPDELLLQFEALFDDEPRAGPGE